jgi:hypothetical protein
VRFYAADRTFIEWHKTADMVEPGTNWTRLAGKFGAGTAAAGPANAQYMTVGAILNIDSGEVPGNRLYQVTGLMISRSEPPPLLPASGTVSIYGSTTDTFGYYTVDTITVNAPGPGTVTVVLNANMSYYGCDSASTGTRYCLAYLYLCTTTNSWCSPAIEASYEDPDNSTVSNATATRSLSTTVNVGAAGPRQFHVTVYPYVSGVEISGTAAAFFTPGALSVTNP